MTEQELSCPRKNYFSQQIFVELAFKKTSSTQAICPIWKISIFSNEQGEQFHQDLKNMEEWYDSRWDMMADYCWSI